MKLLAILAAALSLTLPIAAQAGASATAQATNFRYELIDLDLNDGIAASLTLGTQETVVGVGVNDFTSGDSAADFSLTPGAVSAVLPVGSASGIAAGGTLDLTASFHGTSGIAGGNAIFSQEFVLTANTQLLLYVLGTASTTVDTQFVASSEASLLLFGGGAPQSDSVTASGGTLYSRELSLSLSSGATALNGGFVYSTIATVSAVPEPSQFALLALGLAGLAWRLKRKSRG